jgi:hypothetical protein
VPTFSERAKVTFLHRSVIRTSLQLNPQVARIGKYAPMNIFDISQFFESRSNPETNRNIKVAGENLPVDFLTHKPRISMQSRQVPNSELFFLNQAGFLSISA